MQICNYPCQNGTRVFEIEAIEIPIVYNKYGDHDPNGLLYVLKKMPKRYVREHWRILIRKYLSRLRK